MTERKTKQEERDRLREEGIKSDSYRQKMYDRSGAWS